MTNKLNIKISIINTVLPLLLLLGCKPVFLSMLEEKDIPNSSGDQAILSTLSENNQSLDKPDQALFWALEYNPEVCDKTLEKLQNDFSADKNYLEHMAPNTVNLKAISDKYILKSILDNLNEDSIIDLDTLKLLTKELGADKATLSASISEAKAKISGIYLHDLKDSTIHEWQKVLDNETIRDSICKQIDQHSYVSLKTLQALKKLGADDEYLRSVTTKATVKILPDTLTDSNLKDSINYGH
jgi:hypothetical protein